MTNLVRRLIPEETAERGAEYIHIQEWLATNGLGGYASGTVSGVSTRRYHGLLVAALPSPFGRVVMLNHLLDFVVMADGSHVQLGSSEELAGNALDPWSTAEHLVEFRMELGLPVWHYRVGEIEVEKRVVMPHRQNTVYISYRLLKGSPGTRLQLRPSMHFRPHEQPVSETPRDPYSLTIVGDRYEVHDDSDLPPLRLLVHGNHATLTVEREMLQEVLYRMEANRGYEALGALWSPGCFDADLTPDRDVVLVASTESWETLLALTPEQSLQAENLRRRRLLADTHIRARDGLGAELTLAANQFVITPAGRVEDAARAHAAGDEVRTVIAGYHWFTDWGRDTMISLEGLTLTTGRADEAGFILRTFAHYVRDGLIPNLFPEGNTEGLYNTADATLWFFHALDRYLVATADRETLRLLLPTLESIVDWHLRGTRFGIGVDPSDGLIRQGQEGIQLTWMDAKVDDWIVTPRRGKAVEINALWYNALRLLEGWIREEGDEDGAARLGVHAEQTRQSFNNRFWNETSRYLYDVVDGENGDDPACRPNQIFAISLANPVLERARWEAVVGVVKERLLTPVGLRSLAPGEPDYKPRYDGDLRSRDAAYHQGTVWAWLIGPFIDAWLACRPNDVAGARAFLDGFSIHLSEASIGSISEVFDAEPPFTPRGCIAQAWSVAEVLRGWVRTAPTRESP